MLFYVSKDWAELLKKEYFVFLESCSLLEYIVWQVTQKQTLKTMHMGTYSHHFIMQRMRLKALHMPGKYSAFELQTSPK